MAVYSQSIFGPDLQTGHPLTIVPLTDAGDSNAVVYDPKPGVGGVADQEITWNFKISWLPVAGAVSYNLYGGISPYRQENLLQSGITDTFITYAPPVFVENLRYYFWVAAVNAQGDIAYLTFDPATLETTVNTTAWAPNPLTPDPRNEPTTDGLNSEMQKAFQYIRANHRLQLQIGAEPGVLFKRRQGAHRPDGIPCPCTSNRDDADPDFQARGRCSMCFGTGIIGGFYPGVPILFRYDAMPKEVYNKVVGGFQVKHTFNSWTLHEPHIDQDDLFIRLKDGARYQVGERQESSMRALTLHQEFDLREVERTSILYQVTNKSIEAALTKAKTPGFSQSLWKIWG